MFKIPRFLVFILALCFTFGIYAQQQTALEPGPYVPPPQNPDKEVGTNVKTVEEPIQQTDEFGFFNGNAYLTMGPTGYAAIPNGLFHNNVAGSVEAWIYQTSTSSSVPAIITRGATANQAFYFGLNNSSGSVLFLRFGNTPLTNTGGTTIPLNTWTHVAATWTGPSGNHTVIFYVNGAQSGPTVVGYTGVWNTGANDSTYIGLSQAFGGDQWNGSIDEIKYWDQTRTAAQIRDNRFVGLGDGSGANTGSALTSSSHYAGLLNAWNFNTGSFAPDYIGGGALTAYYRAPAGAFYASPEGVPIPYNFTLICPFGANDYVTVPDNAVFNAATGGTVEAWVYPTGQTTTHMLISRGTTGFQFFWGIRASIGNRQAVNIGSGAQFQNSNGTVIPINQWSHVAMTWVQSGGNYTCTFYVNGQQSGTPVTNATTWNSLSGTLRIGGWHGGTANNWNGRIDEVKFWNQPKSLDQIRQSMFCSPRGFSTGANTGLVGAWSFDGNLLEWSPSAAGNGSFSTGGTNNCRLSGFINETSTGTPSTTFVSQITNINRRGTPQPFPGGFALKVPYKPITDNATTRDTITLGGVGTTTSVELFLSIRHTFCGDLDIILRAPNGQTRDVTSDNGSTGENVLTFFTDAGPLVTNTAFLPPWSYNARPEALFSNMGGSSTNGNWIIEVFDDAGGDVGVLQGWGIRLNGSSTAIDPITNNIPGKFNLFQNYPNPFNPVTNIKFDIPQDVNTKLVVYDILGREVRTLVNEFTKAGQYEVQFDASNIASGTYFYRIEAGEFSDVKKFVVVK